MLATTKTLLAYRALIVPRARREIRRWAHAAETIPDPTLRHAATSAIATDTGNALAISALAATAPRRLRRRTVELVVTYQVLVDYIDRLNEGVCVGQLLRGLRVGLALSSALAEPASPIKVDPLGDDGGYLAGLVASCRERLWSLPSAAAIQQQARAAATRCSEALAYTHTAAEEGPLVEVRRWTTGQNAPGRYAWWELAAGGTSNIVVSALLAAASDPETTAVDATKVATAYWPHICVLSTMLDSLVDFERDAITGEFSFVSYYASAAAAGEGLIRAARLALGATRSLRHRRIHAMIVYGVAGYYAASAVRGSLASIIAPRLVASLGPTAMPIALTLRASRRIRASREAGTQPADDLRVATLGRDTRLRHGP